MFAGITGDLNPIHINQVYAESTHFRGRLVHGALLSGLISSVLGMHLPGEGAIYASQHLDFKAPVYIGDTITAEVEVVEVSDEQNRVCMVTRCYNQRDEVVAEGGSLLLPRKQS